MYSLNPFQKCWFSGATVVNLLLVVILSGCQSFGAVESSPVHAASAESVAHHDAEASQGHAGHASHATSTGESRPELTQESPIELNPNKGQEIGSIFEAYLSPHQEGGEEEDTPDFIPAAFQSTAPSVPRNERQSRGHGVIAFTNDLSKAYVHVAIENVDPEDIVMFHIHCGRPGQLGPIIVDFALAGDLQEYLTDNVLALEIVNDDLVAAASHGEGLVGAFTAGCPIVPANPVDKVTTIAGMETIAREGQLYFNLHTKGQVFFGDIRGKLQEVKQ